MKKILITVLVLYVYFSNVEAQNTDKKCNFRISGFGIEGSVNELHSKPYTFDEFIDAYGDQLFIKPIDSLNYEGSPLYGQTYAKAGVFLSFSPVTQKHIIQHEFQIGLNYMSHPTAYFGDYITIKYSEDTLVNDPYLFLTKDSTYQILASYYQENKEISLSALYLFKTNTVKRISAFAGLGLEVGRAITSYLREYQSYGYNLKYFSKISYPGIYSKTDEIWASPGIFNYETTKIANSTYLRTTIPLGVSMRFSKKDNFFGKMSLNFNARLGLDMMFNPDLGTKTAFFNGWALGLKCAI